MIREVESMDGVGFLGPAATARKTTTPSPGGIEDEISRLTWSVLDGVASPSDHRRLAELVELQHVARRRWDQ